MRSGLTASLWRAGFGAVGAPTSGDATGANGSATSTARGRGRGGTHEINGENRRGRRGSAGKNAGAQACGAGKGGAARWVTAKKRVFLQVNAVDSLTDTGTGELAWRAPNSRPARRHAIACTMFFISRIF